jgi:NTE family protein
MDSERAHPAERLALALSGGGSRAMAFHLGCLRALHAHGLLQQAQTISAVSGGSVLAALYCQHPGDFASFEATVRSVLMRGFVGPSIKKAVTSLEGLKALVCLMLLSATQVCLGALRFVAFVSPIRSGVRRRAVAFLATCSLQRFASRTTILRRVFADELFTHKTLTDLRTDRPKLIIVACELRTKTAFYFARDGVGSWRLGKTDPANIQIAHAVAASAAYPGLLPALDEHLDLEKRVIHIASASSLRMVAFTTIWDWPRSGLTAKPPLAFMPTSTTLSLPVAQDTVSNSRPVLCSGPPACWQ